MSKYSFGTAVGILVDTPETRALIEELLPDTLTHPMLDMARSMPLAEALGYVAGMFPADAIETFRQRLAEIE